MFEKALRIQIVKNTLQKVLFSILHTSWMIYENEKKIKYYLKMIDQCNRQYCQYLSP